PPPQAPPRSVLGGGGGGGGGVAVSGIEMRPPPSRSFERFRAPRPTAGGSSSQKMKNPFRHRQSTGSYRLQDNHVFRRRCTLGVSRVRFHCSAVLRMASAWVG